MTCCSSFHGHISEIPNISVDNFTNRDVKAYFLSHTHTDHTQGLYDYRFIHILRKNNAFIYMSETSAAIVKYELNWRLGQCPIEERDEIVQRIKPLRLGTTSITIPSGPKRKLGETQMTVTLIPAGHSFGSGMLLFRTNSKTVLYTGDFRMSVNDVSKFAQLHDKGAPIHIDGLYVDTTFIDPRYTHFPKRSASVQAALYEIERWLKRDGNNRVAIKTSAKFGYEYVYNELYNKLGFKVYVEDVRWKELYSNLLESVPGVTNDTTPVHLCWPKHRRYHKDCTPFEAVENLHYLNIHLSAQKWTNFQIDDNPLNKLSEVEIDVCFSTHCSRTELLYFVNYFNPVHVEGFPNTYDGRSPVKKFDDVFSVTPKKAKSTEVDRKMDRHVLRSIFDL